MLTKDGDENAPARSRTPQQAYVRWWTPNNDKKITALRNVSFRDFSLKNQRKRFSDWKVVCNGLDSLLSWVDTLPDEKSPTVETVQSNFMTAFEMHNVRVKFLHPSKAKRALIRGAQAWLKNCEVNWESSKHRNIHGERETTMP